MRLDSVAGQQCVIFYRNGVPFHSHWFPPGRWVNHFDIPQDVAGELDQLYRTMAEFNVPHAERQAAVEAFFREKGLL